MRSSNPLAFLVFFSASRASYATPSWCLTAFQQCSNLSKSVHNHDAYTELPSRTAGSPRKCAWIRSFTKPPIRLPWKIREPGRSHPHGKLSPAEHIFDSMLDSLHDPPVGTRRSPYWESRTHLVCRKKKLHEFYNLDKILCYEHPQSSTSRFP